MDSHQSRSLIPRAVNVIHITNGDSAAYLIAASDIGGFILPWRDVLHEGPVPAGLSLGEMREVRARFFDEVGWEGYDSALHQLERRDDVLLTFSDQKEVVLWFEHDLYDQLQLIQLLTFFSRQNLADVRLSLLCTDEYLGTLTPARIRELHEERHEVIPSELEVAVRAWDAFTAPDPGRLVALLDDDTSALPFLDGAMRRFIQQYPSMHNGLSRSEVQALQAIAGGAADLQEAFDASQEIEDRVFLGDAVFMWYVEELSRGRHPLVKFEAPSGRLDDNRPLRNRRAIVTDEGHAVLQGKADRVALAGIDRWYGGVRLSGTNVAWRWDPSSDRLRRG